MTSQDAKTAAAGFGVLGVSPEAESSDRDCVSGGLQAEETADAAMSLRGKRAAAISALEAALDEIQSGEGLLTFVEGHGLQSRVFRFEWIEPSLEIHFRLPVDRVLSGQEVRAADEAEAGAAIRMALLLLGVAQSGKGKAPCYGALYVDCNEDGAGYSIAAPDGKIVEEQNGWSGLVRRLENFLAPDDEAITIIWP